jgi:hypothetical protein
MIVEYYVKQAKAAAKPKTVEGLEA